MPKCKLLTILLALFLCSLSVNAYDETQAHRELRELKEQIIYALNQQNFVELAKILHSNVVITTENGKVIRNRDDAITYFKGLFVGPHQIISHFDVQNIIVDEKAILYSNTAIAFGTAESHFQLTNWLKYTLPIRWTATFVNQANHWELTSYQNTIDLSDLTLILLIKQIACIIIGLVAFVSLVLGFKLGRFTRRHKS